MDIFGKGDTFYKLHNCNVIFMSYRVIIVMDQNSIYCFSHYRKCCGNTKGGSPSTRIRVAKKERKKEIMDLNREFESMLNIWILCFLPSPPSRNCLVNPSLLYISVSHS